MENRNYGFSGFEQKASALEINIDQLENVIGLDIPEMVEPELMYKLFDRVVGNLDDLVKCFWYDGEIQN